MDEALKLLKEAAEVLNDNWFVYDDDGEEYNNDKVISISEKINKFLEEKGEQNG